MSLSPAEIAYQKARINENLQPNLVVATVVCMAAAYVAVLLRCVSRKLGRVKFGKDDFCIIVALLFASAYSLTMAILTRFGLGKHTVTLTKADTGPLGKGALAALVILPVATFAIKASILFLYYRIFPTRLFVNVLWGVGVFVGAFCIASVFVTIFECLPVGAQLTGQAVHCINLVVEYTALSSINAALDFVFLGLPVPLIWGLQMSKKRKAQLIAIFMTGCLACIASVTRAVYSTRASIGDSPYDDTKTAIWTTVEINLSIVSACLPTMRPLIKRILHGKAKNPSAYTYHSSRTMTGNQTHGYQGTQMEVLRPHDDTVPFVRLPSGAASATETGTEI